MSMQKPREPLEERGALIASLTETVQDYHRALLTVHSATQPGQSAGVLLEYIRLTLARGARSHKEK
ncbi:MAG: hypothetical protein ACRDHW_00275 [Ktedonobacteraceae bacterium]